MSAAAAGVARARGFPPHVQSVPDADVVAAPHFDCNLRVRTVESIPARRRCDGWPRPVELDVSPVVPLTIAVMDAQDPLKTCVAPVGRQGGSRSQRTLPSAQARDRVDAARRAFRDYHAQCFWYLRPDLNVTLGDVPEIVRGLRRNGGRKGFLLAARLCR